MALGIQICNNLSEREFTLGRQPNILLVFIFWSILLNVHHLILRKRI